MTETYGQWRDRQRRNLLWFALALMAAWLIWQIGTSDTADGAAPDARPFVEAPTPAHHSPVWLERGATGDAVTFTQAVLDQWGWTIAVDGDYGPQTESVVTGFQAVSGLTTDGIVGPETWGALQSVATVTATAERGTQVAVGTPPVPPPVDGECDTWRPHVEAQGMPWDWARSIMYRESRCSNVHAYRDSSRDDSYGPFQVNIYTTALERWYADAGYTRSVLATWHGAISAAGALYEACGSGPWQPPYSCSGSGELRRYQP